ncbi:hypothetical protein BGZ83_005260 [Gryganskiella cystojenkinii]|nr:hypothetical protein BGZ83_005260 [Gryganskiella cystojenkinii]
MKQQEELSIVCHILSQASFLLDSAELFDQLWTPAYLKRSFEWTEHLSALLHAVPRKSSLRGDEGHTNLDLLDEEDVVDPRILVAHFLQTSLASKGDVAMIKIKGKDKDLAPVSVEDLLSPTATLCQRLLQNPMISDRVRKEVLCYELDHPSERRTEREIVYNRATAKLLKEVQSHVEQCPQPTQIITIGDQELNCRAKAQIILSKMRNESDARSSLGQEVVLQRLDEYLVQSRAEALGVIQQLLELSEESSYDGDDKAQVDMDTKTFRALLSRRLKR